jgi:hypothetical protein
MRYSIHGPFELKTKNGLVDRSKDGKNNFWAEIENTDLMLPSACGCYLFAIRAAKGIKPWYVGLAAKQSFQRECFTPQKINIYNDVLAGIKKGKPLLFLIAKKTKQDKFVKPCKNGHRDSTYLETLMIGVALEKNPELMNIKKTKFLRGMCVPCLINTPNMKPFQSEQEFNKAINRKVQQRHRADRD